MGSAISARRSAVGPTSREGGVQAAVTVREPSSTSSMPASRGRDPGNLHERAGNVNEAASDCACGTWGKLIEWNL
ncbi:unnamed protein product [Lampetra fluviatilis]